MAAKSITVASTPVSHGRAMDTLPIALSDSYVLDTEIHSSAFTPSDRVSAELASKSQTSKDTNDAGVSNLPGVEHKFTIGYPDIKRSDSR